MSASKIKNLQVSDQQFPVVGIGASAGGLEAFKQFLKTIPDNSGMAYVIVQHLSPTHDTHLPEILQKFTKTPVQLIADNVLLAPDHIYIIPPDKMLTAVDGVLKLEPIKNRKVKIIDLFFSSLGVVHQSFAVGVVLSGALDDGTLGLQVIKSYGGLTFAQDEASAAFDSMPKSAIRSGAVDFILPADQIIPKLIVINGPFHTGYTSAEIKRKEPEQDEEVFRLLLAVLRIRRGVDFTNYKQSTIKRRMVRRMALNKINKTQDYLVYLRENKAEQDALYNDLLISVTNFFRDTQSFDLLCSVIFPGIIHQKTANEPLRIWVAGCATGEEAYSMAICLQEYLGDKASALKIQIFATDISETAIAKARTGIYRQADLASVSSQRIQQFFNKTDGNYQVNKATRDMCVFAHHNLLKDPPFSKIDLVSCRNVLIYLEPILQKRALSAFHYALNEKGYLILGKSETVSNNADLFMAFNQHEKIYQAKGQHVRTRNMAYLSSGQSFKEAEQDMPSSAGDHDPLKLADALLLSKYTPAGVIVNQVNDIIQFRGKTDAWLAVPAGKPSFNIMKMAREGLSFEIRNLLHLAKTKKTAVRKEGISFRVNDEPQYVNIEVVPIPEIAEEYNLVLFQNSIQPIPSFLPENGDGASLYPQENINAWVQRIEQLEKELAQTREDMRAVTEAQEAANEELQSANEELLSGSEELQSLNEELETSKEELQSTNEEIIIVNTELVDRNEQLNSSRRYTEEIFNTIHDPLLVLDGGLKVLRATDGFYQMFKVGEDETEGKFLYDLGNRQWNITELRNLLENILPEQGYFVAYEVDHVFNTIGRRIMQLTARQFDTHTNEKLILLAIHDITDKRKVEEGLAQTEQLLDESEESLKFAVESAGLGTWDFTLQKGGLILDNRAKALMGLGPEDHPDYNGFLNLIYPDDRADVDNAVKSALDGINNGEFNAEYRLAKLMNEKPRWIKSKGKAYFDKENKATRFIGTVLDISTEKLIQENTRELLKKKDEFISIASHELKTPITSIKAVLQVLNRAMAEKEGMENLYPLVQKANKQSSKLTDLIKDLLDVTRIQSGKIELNKSDFSIEELIRECCEQLPGRPKDYKIELLGEEGLRVYADRNRIEQVLVNLVNNAIKYAPQSNTLQINITQEERMAKVAVTDYGIGIEKEKIPLIFDRYFRVEETSKNYSGLGLGLYISAEIVNRHRGRIGLESKPGKGSTFWFTVPLAE